MLISESIIEQGEYILLIQIQNDPVVTSKLESLCFNVALQSKSGNLFLTDIPKPNNFMERVFSELAMRKPSEKTDLKHLLPDGHMMRMWSHFSPNENIYVQVFANRDPNKVWVQKLRPTMVNFEVHGMKNRNKPVEVRIEPGQERAVIFQQVNAETFEFIGGKGDFMAEPFKSHF
jgi:hypothetical protein